MVYEWFQNIVFKNNWVLPFLLMLPVIAYLYYRTASRRKSSLTVSTSEAFSERSSRNFFLNFPFWLRLLSIGFVILALARPQVHNQLSQTKGEGIDIILCMDVSGSMLSPDFYPNRLEVAKEMATQFILARPVDQIGLVIFSGESYTQFPLSTDHQSLLQQVQAIKSGMLEDGTLIGEGLATSVQRLAGSKGRTKVVILLTDGKEEAPDTRLIDPYTALEIAKAKGVRVYSIGMAGNEPVVIHEKGKVTRSTPLLDEALLQRIAKQTGGRYFRAKDKESLEEVYKQIDRLEKSEVEIVRKEKVDERFVYFLLAALFCIAFEIMLRYTILRTFP
ncbi:MAG: VWA domain-containing protein [Chitinophagaceae bacterium]